MDGGSHAGDAGKGAGLAVGAVPGGPSAGHSGSSREESALGEGELHGRAVELNARADESEIRRIQEAKSWPRILQGRLARLE